MKSLSRVRLFATPWTVTYQASPSMGFSRQKYWSGLPFPRGSSRPRDRTRVSCIGGRCFNLWATREAPTTYKVVSKWSIVRKAVLWVVNKLTYTSVQFSCSVVYDSLQPHGLQHARLPCPSPTLRAYSNSCPSSQWCHPTCLTHCHPLLLPSIFLSIMVFSSESVHHIR